MKLNLHDKVTIKVGATERKGKIIGISNSIALVQIGKSNKDVVTIRIDEVGDEPGTYNAKLKVIDEEGRDLLYD